VRLAPCSGWGWFCFGCFGSKVCQRALIIGQGRRLPWTLNGAEGAATKRLECSDVRQLAEALEVGQSSRMVFAGITVNEAVPALLVISLSAIALFTFFDAEGQRAGWCKCITCLRWFDRGGKTTEKPSFFARIGPQPRGLCPPLRQS
jgi:hypothetical protein